MEASTVFRFDAFVLDVDNQELRREGQPIPLRPKPFALLRYFVENPKRLIPNTELLNTLWPDTVVVEGLGDAPPLVEFEQQRRLINHYAASSVRSIFTASWRRARTRNGRWR